MRNLDCAYWRVSFLRESRLCERCAYISGHTSESRRFPRPRWHGSFSIMLPGCCSDCPVPRGARLSLQANYRPKEDLAFFHSSREQFASFFLRLVFFARVDKHLYCHYSAAFRGIGKRQLVSVVKIQIQPLPYVTEPISFVPINGFRYTRAIIRHNQNEFVLFQARANSYNASRFSRRLKTPCCKAFSIKGCKVSLGSKQFNVFEFSSHITL